MKNVKVNFNDGFVMEYDVPEELIYYTLCYIMTKKFANEINGISIDGVNYEAC